MCSCYKNGKTIEPPHKELVKFEDGDLFIDIYTNISQKEREEKYYKMEEDFDEWKNTACEHENMELSNEYLTNTMGMIDFKSIIDELGGEEIFPILTKYLPSSNDGYLSVNLIPSFLQELIRLEKTEYNFEEILLIEKETEELKASVNIETYKHFAFSEYNKNIYGIDNKGFYILEKKKDDYFVVFRSNNFVQKKIIDKEYEFTDLENGYKYISSIKLHPFDNEPLKDHFFTTKAHKSNIENEFKYIIDPLKKLCKAAIESDNPICWS